MEDRFGGMKRGIFVLVAALLSFTSVVPLYSAVPFYNVRSLYRWAPLQVATSVLPGGTCDPAGDPIDRPVVIWHIPHPDDEILGMAGGIYESVLAGHHNIVVLYTVGESSLVRVKLVARALMQPLLQPADSGHIVTVPLRAADFGRARLSESIAALSLLGVNEDCIIVVELPDRALTQQRALTVMRELALLYPAAAHRTTSVYDAHVDHRTLARALYALAQEYRKNGVELDIGFYRVYIYKTPSTRRAAKANVKAVPVVDPDVKRQALAEFFMWDPAAGRFAIGGQSVPKLFREAAADPYEYIDDFSLETAPWLLRRGDIRLALYNASVSISYSIRSAWADRLENPYKQLAPAVSRVGNASLSAKGSRAYAGSVHSDSYALS